MAKAKEEKTNVMRILEQKQISYTAHTYEHEEGVAVDGVTVAAQLGQDPECVFKTLVARGPKKGIHVFCIPVCCELDLKKAAKAAGDKSMEMVHVKELLGLTGYIRGGCSPVGMKKKYPTFFDETCILWDEIAVSAGARGHQMILPPLPLVALVGAKEVDLIQ
jgi:Cys-tRNA(Pro)/Cys-tRNA(Cys) deacylase